MMNNQSFFNSVKAKNLEEVEAFIRDGRIDVDCLDSDGLAALHHASIKRCKELVNCLISVRATVDVLTTDALTPLYYAVKEGHLDIARLLLDYGANIDAVVDSDGFTILGTAIKRGYAGMVELLLERGADKDSSKVLQGLTPLSLALSHGARASEVVGLLLSKGADCWKLNEDGTTCLFHAVRPAVDIEEESEVVRQLLAHVHSTNWCNVKRFVRYTEPNSGKSALNWACEFAYSKAVYTLFTHGADYRTINLDAQRQLMEQENDELRRERFRRIEVLLSKQGQRDLEGWNELHRAAANGSIEEYEDLLRQGYDINLKTNKGQTVLHTAAIGGKNEIVQDLLNRGFNVNSRDNDGKTPLHCAAEFHHIESIELLANNRADMNAKMSAGLTPLHLAVGINKLYIVVALVRRGTRPDVKDDYGRLPIDLATDERVIGFLRGALERRRRMF